jgi:membrane protein DedA with SNARE-associated domain
MSWTFWGLAIQTVAGLLGAHAAAGAAHEHRFGFIGHSIAGLVGGALSGAFLQEAAVTIVTGSGSQNPSTTIELAIIHALTGAVAGGILMFAVGFLQGSRSDGLRCS